MIPLTLPCTVERRPMSTPQLSVVITVYNEEQGLHALFELLYILL